jgi:signal transduction histidine kinase
MTIGATLNRSITQLAVGRHLPHRTVRIRLTLLYGGLFLVSGAALMAITYALLVNAGFVFTIGNSTSAVATGSPPQLVRSEPSSAFPTAGSTHPSAQTMAHWRNVAQCMRDHGISGFPDPTTSVPLNVRFIGELSNRDGAILAIPATSLQSPAFIQVAGVCGFDGPGVLTPHDVQRRTHVRQELLIQSGIALAAMSLLSLGLGWLMAGRVLQPLEDSYQAQRQFVANASHELRAPLTRQRALIEVALASPEADLASLQKAHERVLAAEQHLEQLIDALLALSRGQAGLERRERLDLAALTSEAIVAHESELTGFDLRTTLDPAATPGDPRLLERLITNLIDNAIRHNTPGGHVEIATGTRDRHAFVSIANSGPAVPPEEIQRLLQPFERLGGARTGHNSGHGLGLSIVQAIANAHGADLDAHARPEGGLTIEVAFPVAIGGGARLKFASVRSSGPRRSARRRPWSGARG